MNKSVSALLLLVCALATGSVIAAERYEEGVDYSRVVPAQPTATDNQVEVVEVFWYGCPHCYDFEPYIKRWLKSEKPGYVDYRRMPAIFRGDRWRPQAAAFYTAEVLGVKDRIHDDFFHAWHEGHRRLTTPEQLADFFAEHGVDRDEFLKTYRSFAVQTKVGRAREMTQRYGLDGVPAMIVNGRYRVSASQARSFERMLDITDFLAAKEAARMGITD